MKRFLMSAALVLLSAGVSWAQCGNIPASAVTVTPAVYTAEDSITVTVDLSGTCMAADGVAAMKVWMFSPGCCGAITQGDFCNDTYNGAVLNGRNAVSLGNNRWSYSLRMTTVLDRPAAQIASFGIIFKASDRNPCTNPGNGNRQTQDLILVPQPLVFVERVARLFPRQCTDEDVVTLYVNRALSANLTAVDTIYFYAFADVRRADGTTDGNRAALGWCDIYQNDNFKLVFGGTSNQFKTFVPRRLFNLADGERLQNFKIVLRGKGGPGCPGVPQESDIVFPLQEP